MTNFERIKAAKDAQELAKFMCDHVMEAVNDGKEDDDCIFVCDICPVRKLCSVGNTGFSKWLERGVA